ncbi:MAG: uroporphyrinogen decarboxylase, partial [Armatimonadetes bacterium]|nr:uroporphyrinogen decarboxylase [Armatimonadota bacterium]
MTGRERIVRHLRAESVDHLPCMPITMQFAARLDGVAYGAYARDHRVLAQAQVRVAEVFGFDHVSAISDPAREAHDLGAAVIFADDSPPAMDGARPLIEERRQLADLLDRTDVCGPRMTDRLEGIALLRRLTNGERLVEGWIEGPCAEAADLRGINNLMTDFTDDPEFVNELFEFVLLLEVGFARRQIEAGADIIGIGDAAASLVGPRIYGQFVLPYQKRMVEAVHGMGALVRLHICGNTRRVLAIMGETGSDIVDLDYPSPVAEGRAAMGPDQVLLGNMDPVRVLRDRDPSAVRDAIAACHAEAGPRLIVGIGCEAPRDTPHENLRALVAYA